MRDEMYFWMDEASAPYELDEMTRELDASDDEFDAEIIQRYELDGE